MRLLLVEDARDLADALLEGLRAAGYATDHAVDGEEASQMTISHAYQAIILDRGLPKRDGLAVCRNLRSRGDKVPVLILTARDALDDRIEGLDAGADDYLVKPFAVSELLARLRALLRRSAALTTNVLSAAETTLDLVTGRVTSHGQEVELSAKERLLLTALLRRPGAIVTVGSLLEQAWESQDAVGPEVVRAHVKNLRRKLGADAIQTVHGVGYRHSV